MMVGSIFLGRVGWWMDYWRDGDTN